MTRNYIQAFTCIDKQGFRRCFALKPGITSPERSDKRYQENLRDMRTLLSHTGMIKKLGLGLKIFGVTAIKQLDLKSELIDSFDTSTMISPKPEDIIFGRIPADLRLKTDGKWTEFCKNDALVLDAFRGVKAIMSKFEPTFKEFAALVADPKSPDPITVEVDELVATDSTVIATQSNPITDHQIDATQQADNSNATYPIADMFDLSVNDSQATITLIGHDDLNLQPEQRKWSFSLTTKGRVRFQIGGIVARHLFKTEGKYKVYLDAFKSSLRHKQTAARIEQLRTPKKNFLVTEIVSSDPEAKCLVPANNVNVGIQQNEPDQELSITP